MITAFFNPFEKTSEQKQLLVGLLTLLVGGLLGYLFNARYDGVIDLHFTEKVQYSEPLVDLLIVCGTTSILLFGLGKIINSKTRFIDILYPTLWAKIPYTLITFFNINQASYKSGNQIMEAFQKGSHFEPSTATLALLLIEGAVMLAALMISVVWLFNGFKVATNSKGTRNNIYFILILMLAEVLSKYLISAIN
ncbi:hypothetical protein KIH23_03575 [Flavobacterium sp. CYK-55]|uniref:hypothetical protein n=1 Tax=Flavobacterium sp. CYK-55 TaxID=2835529 RepID=UPI001BCE7C2D|nr:hypothetical protein [Flavobacterium sp. CYK-55]MBS7786366.1 hypothetical protein [Flavobacterium sp. CYK-55]